MGTSTSAPEMPNAGEALPRREGADVVDRRGILQRGEVAEVGLAEIRAADDAPQDLGVARLRQLRHEANGLGPQRLAEELGDLVLYLALERGRSLAARAEHAEHDDRLALDLVRHAHGGGLAHRGMRHRGRLDLRRTDALAGDLQRVVAASLDVPVALVVDPRPVAVLPDAGPATPVGREVAAIVAGAVLPEAACHPRPGPPDHELAHRAAHGPPVLVDDVGVHARHRSDERARLDRRPGGAADDAAGDLGAAGVIDDGAARLADVAEVPPPRVGVPRLAGRTEDEERAAIVLLHRLLAAAHETADRRRGDAEVRDLVALDHRPHPRRVGEIRRAVVHHDRRAEHEPAGDEPGTHHPTDAGGPADDAAVRQVEAGGGILRGLH